MSPRLPADHYVTAQDGLMQWRAMRMVAFGIEAVRIEAGIEQESDDIRMSLLRRER